MGHNLADLDLNGDMLITTCHIELHMPNSNGPSVITIKLKKNAGIAQLVHS